MSETDYARCSFEGCTNPVFVFRTEHGPLCNGHYAQCRKQQVLRPLRKRRKIVDQVEPSQQCTDPSGCSRRRQNGRALCQTHQRQLDKHGETRPIREYAFQTSKRCAKSGCEDAARSKGMCREHYRQSWGTCDRGCDRRKYSRRSGLCWNCHMAAKKEAKKAS